MKQCEAEVTKVNSKTYDLFSAAKHTKFPESNVERRAHEGTIFALNDHNIDGAGESSRVYLAIKSANVRHQTAKIVHSPRRILCFGL